MSYPSSTRLYEDRPQYTNQYLRLPGPLVEENTTVKSQEMMQQYQQYREEQQQKRRKLADNSSSIPVPDKFPNREVKATSHIVCVNSALRDTNAWPTVSDFEVPLGQRFQNVYSIKVCDLQFASAANIISSSNNTISWTNSEDIDLGYPVYTATLREGIYTANTLQTELATKMNSLNRRNGTGALHYFLVTIDLDTSIVSFTSLSNLALPSQPITYTANSNILTIALVNHGFTLLSTIYFSGVLSLPGIDSSLINGQSLSILSIVSSDVFTVEVNGTATADGTGGGTSASVGSPADFKFLWGSTNNTCADVLGFADQDTGTLVGVANPLTSSTLSIDSIVAGSSTYITSYSHGLQVGDYVKLIGLSSNPTSAGLDGKGQVVTVTQVDTPDSFYTNFATTSVDSSTIADAFLGTGIITLQYTNHGMNQISSIESNGDDSVILVTVLAHNLATGSVVFIGGTNCVPDILGSFTVTSTPDDYTFTIDATAPVTQSGTRGIINATGKNIITSAIPATNGTTLITVTTANEHALRVGQNVYISFPSAYPSVINGLYEVISISSGYTFIFDLGVATQTTGPIKSGSLITFSESFLLYNVVPTTNFHSTALNNIYFTIRDILDADFFTFTMNGSYEQTSGGVTFGGNTVILSSDQHGYAGSISNVDSTNAIIRPVNLSGPDQCFLCCPGLGLSSVSDAGAFVTNIMAKILLSGEPGTVLFDQFVQLPNIFSRGLLSSIDTLRLQLLNADGSFLSTNNVDYSLSFLINYISYNDTGSLLDSQTMLKYTAAEDAMARAIANGRCTY